MFCYCFFGWYQNWLKLKRMINTALFFSVLITLVVLAPPDASAVTLAWDPNDPPPDGYMIYIRLQESGYNYDAPAWVGSTSSCTLEGLIPGTTYYMVVRAYEGSAQSGDSNEISYTPPLDAGLMQSAQSSTAGMQTVSNDDIDENFSSDGTTQSTDGSPKAVHHFNIKETAK